MKKIKLYTYSHIEAYILSQNPRVSISGGKYIDTIVKLMDDSGVFVVDIEKYSNIKSLVEGIILVGDRSEWWYELILECRDLAWAEHDLRIPHNSEWKLAMEKIATSTQKIHDCCVDHKIFSDDKYTQEIIKNVITHLSKTVFLYSNAREENDLIKMYTLLQ